MTADDRYTVTGATQWAVTATCNACPYTTAKGSQVAVKAAIERHLATEHPTRTVISAGYITVGECDAGHTYDAIGRGADPGLFDTWWTAHRDHVKIGLT